MIHRADRIAYGFSEPEIRRAAEIGLFPEVFELRAVEAVVAGDRRPGIYSGYFERDAIDELIAALSRIERAAGIYFTPNLVKDCLLARSVNRARIVRSKEEITTKDDDIAERRWILIDVDPEKPAGISATEQEKSATLELATAIDYELWDRGLPPGIIGDSGNGTHIMIPSRMPAKDGGTCKKLLEWLAATFNNGRAKVDTGVHNAARIWKLPGTLACKGDHAPALGRIHRMSRILTVCEDAPRC